MFLYFMAALDPTWSEVKLLQRKEDLNVALFVQHLNKQQDQGLLTTLGSKTQARVKFTKIGNINYLVTATKINSAPCIG